MSTPFYLMSGDPLASGVTLRDIAKRLGISHSTVALALRNAPRIPESRRRQIQAMAESMGYRPNPMATALGQLRSTGKSQPVTTGLAWINFWKIPQDIHRFKEFELYWKGAHELAAWHGYNLEEFICNGDLTLSRLEKVLEARNIHGILIPPHNYSPPGWDSFPWDKYFSVRFGHSFARPRVHVVSSDQLTNSLMAFEKIRGLGYRRIGFVTSKVPRTRFKSGFLMGQFELEPKETVPILILLTGEDNADDQKMLVGWIKKYKPEAILTDLAAMAEMLKRAGIRVPQDIGLATLSIHDGRADAGIDQNPEEIGRAATEMLISLIGHNYMGIPKICREVLIEGEWVNGSTLPPRK
jgi:LacI family transcriptional regulator